jgi:hypothetical protein
MNEKELLAELRRLCDAEGRPAVAARFGVSRVYLGLVLAGKRAIGPSILRGMEVEGRIVYLPAAKQPSAESA